MRLTAQRLAIALAALLASPLAAEQAKVKAAGNEAAPAPEAAMRVQIDPATGKFVVPKGPAGGGAPVAATAAASVAPLRVEKVRARAGGMRIRLDDRFRMEMTATAGAEGKVTHSCEAGQGEAPKAGSPAKEHGHDR